MFTSGTTGEPKGAVLNQVGVMTALMANQLSGALLGARMAAQLGIDLAILGAQRPTAVRRFWYSRCFTPAAVCQCS